MKSVNIRSYKFAARTQTSGLLDEIGESCANILVLAEMLEICGQQIESGWLNGKSASRFGRMIFRETEVLQGLLNAQGFH